MAGASPARSRRSASARSDFDEPGRCEVLVERQRFAKPTVPHDPEARGVDEGVLALIMPAQPLPGRRLLLLGHAVDNEPIRRGQRIQPLEKRKGGAVAVLAPQEGPRLAGDAVGREDLFGSPELLEYRQRIGMSAVAGERPRRPPAGVGELQRR